MWYWSLQSWVLGRMELHSVQHHPPCTLYFSFFIFHLWKSCLILKATCHITEHQFKKFRNEMEHTNNWFFRCILTLFISNTNKNQKGTLLQPCSHLLPASLGTVLPPYTVQRTFPSACSFHGPSTLAQWQRSSGRRKPVEMGLLGGTGHLSVHPRLGEVGIHTVSLGKLTAILCMLSIRNLGALVIVGKLW